MAKLKVALIGAGGIAYAHAEAWIRIGAEVTVCGNESADTLAAQFGLKVCRTFDEAVNGADIVDICTPTPLHVQHVLGAIAAGKNVICEKPVSRQSTDAMQVTAAASAAGVQVYPAHVVRYFPEYFAAKQAVDAGRIGKLAVLRFTRQSSAPEKSWFFDEAASGGIIMDQMIHDLDAARWIAGEVSQVYATISPVAESGQNARELAAQVVLTHTSGAISLARGAWMSAGAEFSTSFDIAGDRGRLVFDSTTTEQLVENLSRNDGDSSYLPGPLDEDPYQAQFEDFLAAFRGEREARVSYSDGIEAVRIVEAALESVHTGRAVALASTAAQISEKSQA